MATAKVSAEYAQEAAEFAEELEENGYRCGFGVLGERPAPGEPPGDYLEIGQAAVFPSEWRADFSKDVRVDDLMFFVAPVIHIPDIELIPLGDWIAGVDEFGGYRDFLRPDVADAPSYSIMVDSDGKELTIESVKRFRPDGITTIYYEIQVRA